MVIARAEAVELLHERALPGLEHERLAGRRPLLVSQVLGEEVGDRERTPPDAPTVADSRPAPSGLFLKLEGERPPLGLGGRFLVRALYRTQPLFPDWRRASAPGAS
jgi:hypothetical protein